MPCDGADAARSTALPPLLAASRTARRGNAGTLRATCTGAFAAPSAIDVALTLVATTTDPATVCTRIEETEHVEIDFVCCRNGTAFAAASNAACFESNLPADMYCRSRPLVTNWGFVNRGPTAPGSPAVMKMDITPNCGGVLSDPDLGTLTATCREDRVMAFNLTSPRFSDTKLAFWYGCARPPRPSLQRCLTYGVFPSNLGPVNAIEPALVTDDVSAYYSWIKRLDPVAYPCTCRDMWWAVTQAGQFRGLSVC